jgi:adenylate kinase family enzyme
MAPPRINVRGTSGSGKTTLAAALARQLSLEHIELDALHHGPNWVAPTAEEFRARVQEAMDAAPRGWVVDGNYDSKLRDLVLSAADTVVWVDTPLPRILHQLWRRTSHRIVNNIELWNGNRESWHGAFWGRESLFVWAVRSYFRHRRQWPTKLARHPGYVRLHSDRQIRAWLAYTVATRSAAVGVARDGDGDAGVDGQHVTGHPAGFVAGQVHGGPADIPG